MIKKIARQSAFQQYPGLPWREWNSAEEDYDFYFPKEISSYILTLPSKSFRGHVRILGLQLTSLIKNLGFDKLIFLGDIDIAWLKREHDYKPAKDALQYLKDNNIGKRFSGALEVQAIELPTFILHLAWMVRTNAILPYVYFIDPGQNFIGNICQYGNVHVSMLNNEFDKSFRDQMAKTRFEMLSGPRCSERFSKTGAIKGRQATFK